MGSGATEELCEDSLELEEGALEEEGAWLEEEGATLEEDGAWLELASEEGVAELELPPPQPAKTRGNSSTNVLGMLGFIKRPPNLFHFNELTHTRTISSAMDETKTAQLRGEMRSFSENKAEIAAFS